MISALPNARIPDTVLQAIRDRITLSDFVGQHVALKRHGQEWTGLCPFHQEKTPSFSVNDRKGIWTCFGGCCQSGDVIDFAQRIYRMPFRNVVDLLASDAGMTGLQATVDPAALERAARRRAEEEAKAKRRLEYALHLWHESATATGSPVEKYLRGRQIQIPIPPSIRYHPEVPYRLEDGKRLYLPTMISQDTDPNGTMVAAHLTFIMRDGSDKANVPVTKKMLGHPRGGGIYLGPVSDNMQIVEGIETGLSLQERTGVQTIAAGATAFLVALKLPELPYCSRLTIGADNDLNGAGEKAALAAAARFRDEGREVRIIKPRGFKDYNDLIRGATAKGRAPLGQHLKPF